MTDYEDYENNLAFPPTTDSPQEKIEKLTKQLEIAIEALDLIDKRKCHMANCLQNCPLRKYYEKDKGCATCLNKACHTALQQIEELEK